MSYCTLPVSTFSPVMIRSGSLAELAATVAAPR